MLDRRSVEGREPSRARLAELERALAAAGPLAFAWRRSAALVHSLDGFGPGEEGCSSRIELGVARERHQRPGVHRVGRLAPGDVVAISGVRVASAGRTLVDLGVVASTDLIERAVECALRHGLVDETGLRDSRLTHRRPGGSRPPPGPRSSATWVCADGE